MKTSLLTLVLILSLLLANSQSLPCGNGRFVTPIFPVATMDSDIVFGHNTTFMGVARDLFMDIFQPAGDTASIRPLIIFAFGGAFISSDRKQLRRLCDSMAKKGYVAATIDYRKYDNPIGLAGFFFNPDDAVDAMAKAMSDFKAAIRFFKNSASHGNAFRVDTSSIIIGGVSSGSIAALHTAYINTMAESTAPLTDIIMANGGIEGNTDLPGSPLIGTYTFAGIRGVWNMSGALFDSGYIKAGDPALFSIHGTADATVPYGYGQFGGVAGYASGSSSLYNQAVKVGVPTSFISVPGGGHSNIYEDLAVTKTLDSTASNFFANILCPSVLAVSGVSLEGSIVNGQVQLGWQTFTENASKGFEVEKQLITGWTSIGSLASKSVNGYSSIPLNYSFNDQQPREGINLYRLKIISLNGDIAYSKVIRVSWNGKSANLFVIYPNPAGNVLNFKATLPGTGTNMLKIYSSNMLLMQARVLNSSQAISISGLPAGVYFAVLSNSIDRQTLSTWFIKK